MGKGKFGTVINCIDGRTQIPVSKWIKDKFDLDYIDTVTEPGVDGIVSNDSNEKIEQIKKKVLISINAHGSKVVGVVGHFECAGNPVSKEDHLTQIRKSVSVIKAWGLPAEIFGLWVNEKWQAEHII